MSLFEAILGTKALKNSTFKRDDALLRAQKVENALEKYPFSDISPHLNLKINPRAKRMALRLDPKQRLVNLVVPKYGTMRAAYMFALENKYWIRQKLDELPEFINFVDGETINILGKPRQIEVTHDKALKNTDIQLKNNKILVFTNKSDPAKRIKRFVIQYAKEQLTALSHEKAAEINKDILSVDVKDTASRWGSCSQDGKLSYSWRLIFAPMHAFDYVVGHEVSHLVHMDHSPAFWHLCEDISADYSKGKSWMKRHSGELIRYN